jgi:hypothetical protein
MMTWDMIIRLQPQGSASAYAHIQVSVHRLSPNGSSKELQAMRAAGLERSAHVPNLYVRDATTPAEIHATLHALAEWLRGSRNELAVTWDFGTSQSEVRWPAVPVEALGL